MCQNNYAMLLQLGNAHHLANQASSTNATSAAHLTMGLAHAQKLTRMVAGQVGCL